VVVVVLVAATMFDAPVVVVVAVDTVALGLVQLVVTPSKKMSPPDAVNPRRVRSVRIGNFKLYCMNDGIIGRHGAACM